MTLGFVSPSLSCFLYLAYAFLENPHLAVVAATLIPLALFASTARMNRSLSLSEAFVPDARTKNAGGGGTSGEAETCSDGRVRDELRVGVSLHTSDRRRRLARTPWGGVNKSPSESPYSREGGADSRDWRGDCKVVIAPSCMGDPPGMPGLFPGSGETASCPSLSFLSRLTAKRESGDVSLLAIREKKLLLGPTSWRALPPRRRVDLKIHRGFKGNSTRGTIKKRFAQR